MSQTSQEENKALVLEAFDTLFNSRDHAAAVSAKSSRLTLWNRELPAFDEVERLVDLDAPGAGLLLGQAARREVVPPAAKPGDEVSTVTRSPQLGHRGVPLRNLRESARLAENWRKSTCPTAENSRRRPP
jgi:hypothetical protein